MCEMEKLPMLPSDKEIGWLVFIDVSSPIGLVMPDIKQKGKIMIGFVIELICFVFKKSGYLMILF